jgi:hypothetical protein
MTATLSCLRSVPIYPVGSDKPLAIHRPTKEVVEAAREAVIADQEALKVLKDMPQDLSNADQDISFNTGASTAVDEHSLNTQGADDLRRGSIVSRRSFDQTRHNVGLRRAGQAPDGLE